jgi:hypothetical protein
MATSDRERDYSAAHDFPSENSKESVDSVLYGLLEIIEFLPERVGLSVIVLIPGGAIRGLIVSRREWYKEWLSGLKSSGSETGLLGSMVNAVHESVGRLSEDGSLLDHGVTYLHLLDAALVNPNGSTNKMPWRIRLDHVSGWSLGSPQATS